MAAAESAWGRFRKISNEPPVELRLAVSESPAGERPEPKMPRGQGHLISFVHDHENYAICDLRAGFGYGWVTRAVAHDPTYVRYHFVENCVYIMLQSMYLTPAHAACVSRNGRAVLLCGLSTAGKSTLAYACAKHGWTYICDDGANLIRQGTGRVVVGNAYQIRLRPQTVSLFPELARYTPLDRPNGKPSLEVDTPELGIDIAEQGCVEHVIFLNRSTTERQHLARYDKEEALQNMSQVICYGDDALRAEMTCSLERLLTAPIYQMTYHDLAWAEERLRSLVNNGE